MIVANDPEIYGGTYFPITVIKIIKGKKTFKSLRNSFRK